MRRLHVIGAALAMTTLVAGTVSAQKVQKIPRPCAIIASFDSAGMYDAKYVRDTRCDAGSILLIAACSLDTTNDHTFAVSKSMLHRKLGKTYNLLPDDVKLKIGKAPSATMPSCATTGVLLPPETDFDDGNLAKDQHGAYRYNGDADGTAFDPDLDVSPPSGILKGSQRRR